MDRLEQLLKPMPKLTKQMRKAGIVEVLSRNADTSYNCVVELECMNRQNYRKEQKRHSNHILAEFDEKCVKNLDLIYRSGKLFNIDGWHRSLCLFAKEEKYWTANVFMELSEQESAHIFYQLNTNNLRMDPWDTLLAGQAAGYSWAKTISGVFVDYELTTPNTPGFNKKTADITAYSPFAEAFNRHSEEMLQAMCEVLVGCYLADDNTVQGGAKGVEFLRGLLDFLTEQGVDNHNVVDFKLIGKICQRLIRRSASQIASIADENYTGTKSRPARNQYCQAFYMTYGLSYGRAA